MVRDAVPFDEPDEIRWRVPRQRRFREVRVGGEKIVGPRVQVGEVAAASAGDQDLLARPIRALQHRDTASAAARFDRGHQARGAGAEDEDIEIVPSHNFNYQSSSRNYAGDRVCTFFQSPFLVQPLNRYQTIITILTITMEKATASRSQLMKWS